MEAYTLSNANDYDDDATAPLRCIRLRQARGGGLSMF